MTKSSGLEVDAVIELDDGRWAAIEVKMSEGKAQEGISSLKRLREKLCANAAAGTREPEFMMVLVGISEYARGTEEGVYAVPVRLLGKWARRSRIRSRTAPGVATPDTAPHPVSYDALGYWRRPIRIEGGGRRGLRFRDAPKTQMRFKF